MIIPLPTIILATYIEKYPKLTGLYDTQEVELKTFKIMGIRFSYWLKYLKSNDDESNKDLL